MRYELAQETRERDTPKVEMDHSIWVYDKKIFNNQIWELGHEYDN